MPPSTPSPGARLRTLWHRLSALPGGRWLFSRALGFMVPYTGSLGARVLTFEPGHVVVELKERRAVRNHLASVHAMALANVGELATGLAMLGGLPTTVRGILTGFDIEFRKKARGRLLVESRCEVPEVTTDQEFLALATISDDAGDTVAVVRARWRLGPMPSEGR
jgi:acyl-coenzyme A thioesterase PaaI-like protein